MSEERVADDATRALRVLAALASRAEDHDRATIPLDWFIWQPVRAVEALTRLRPPTGWERLDPLAPSKAAHEGWPTVERHLAERLAAVDQLRYGSGSLRVGWLFVAGTTTGPDGAAVRVFEPLLSRPVRVEVPRMIGNGLLVPAGDVTLTRFVGHPPTRARLEAAAAFGGGALSSVDGVEVPVALLDRLPKLRAFAVDAAAAAGWTVSKLVPAGAAPATLQRGSLVIVVGVALYAGGAAVTGSSLSASLSAWADRPIGRSTAFHALYAGSDPDPDPSDGSRRPGSDPVTSPFELTPAQGATVARSRRAPVTVVRGAPGTGKSHTIAAIAADALGRGETVLMAARSDSTVDALVDLFERAPGPRPVVFGSHERKDALALKLADGLDVTTQVSLDRAAEQRRLAIAARDELREVLRARLAAELLVAPGSGVHAARAAWPRLFEAGADLDALRRLHAVATADRPGWRRRRRARRARAELEAVTGPPGSGDVPFEQALDLAAAWSRARAGTDDVLIRADEWAALADAERSVRERAAAWLELESRSPARRERAALGAVAALATALRSGRAARRAQLSNLDRSLTTALPLWVGTLVDIEDLLPAEPALFDLVILDEASSVDQPSAAVALLRGARAVVVGDPHQLRHVSFLSDERRDQALVAAGVPPSSSLAARLDVRRNSAFDVAAGAAEVLTLDEQFRCYPHLVQFVAHRLYGGHVHVARRTPVTETIDCIRLTRLDGDRDESGAVPAEVSEVVTLLRRAVGEGDRSVGVVTPFRAQADALEATILERFTRLEIERLDLRMGTVHSFLGVERDLVIVSMGIDAGAHSAAWRFVEDPHLFTVLATRARTRMVVLLSADPPPGGLVSEYLTQVDTPPGAPEPRTPSSAWVRRLADGAAEAGVRAIPAYPSGRHVVDLALGDDRGYLGVEAQVHPDGPDAHLDRHLDLAARGWRLVEARPRAWDDRAGELIVELTAGLPRRPPPAVADG